MVQLRKTASFIALTAVAGIAGMTATPRTVQAQGLCVPVYGIYQANVTTTDCTSPIGLCATGTITGSDLLNSSSVFVALDTAPSAGLPAAEPAANASYSGTLTIDGLLGTLTLRDLGVIDSIHGNFSELERPTSGTGIFTNASNDFFISGTLSNNQNTFTGMISGQLCGVL
jgi:hypothetical protein